MLVRWNETTRIGALNSAHTHTHTYMYPTYPQKEYLKWRLNAKRAFEDEYKKNYSNEMYLCGYIDMCVK